MEDKSLWQRMLLRCLGLSLAVLLCFYALPFCYGVASPFFFALATATLLRPCLAVLEEEMKWKRQTILLWLLGMLAYGLLGVLWIILPTLVQELWQLGENGEKLLAQSQQVGNLIQGQIEKMLPWDSGDVFGVETAMIGLKTWLSAQVAVFLQGVSAWILALPSGILRFFVFLLATYFLSCDFPKYAEKQEKLGENLSLSWKNWGNRVKYSVGHAFSAYLKAQALLSLGVAGIMAVGFLWMELPFALLLALGIGVLDFIPMIGTGLVLVPWGLVLLFMGNSQMAWQIGGIWLGTMLFRHVLEPKVLGNQTGLSPLLSLAGIYVGLQVAGIWGMILAPIFLLIVLNLLALGLFEGLIGDVKLCYGQSCTWFGKIFQQREEKNEKF